ncbi:MAG: quinone-dependent dihydroorotate dehydrogenase [Bacteroidota bacterium]|nr:quinone-dependent dihydroorotate dehydrogenase [Bacteroidota bacterium]
MYKIFRPLFFLIDPERIHAFVFGMLRFLSHLPGGPAVMRLLFDVNDTRLEKKVFGLTFRNPVGLAAGFDKDAKLIDALSCLGFGFIEIGTLTPREQPGNEKPRLFRLPKDQALVNRMGFNNEGVLAAARRLKGKNRTVVIGGNIGKNKSTPNEKAYEDYTFCFNALYDCVDYFVVNVSSPNTPGLRELQEKAPLRQLLKTVKELSLTKPVARPVLLKIAPDLTTGQLDDIVDILKATGIDGVIATNTTISREALQTTGEVLASIGAGGLSGKPLKERSNEIIRYLREKLGKDFPIIGVGGIMSAADALEKLQAGADLVQVYTGFIYDGPGLMKRINKRILESEITTVQSVT